MFTVALLIIKKIINNQNVFQGISSTMDYYSIRKMNKIWNMYYFVCISIHYCEWKKEVIFKNCDSTIITSWQVKSIRIQKQSDYQGLWEIRRCNLKDIVV